MTDTMVAERDRQTVSRDENRQTAGSGVQRQASERRNEPTLTPRVDVLEDATGITVLADLPGVARDALEIHVEGDSLTIEGAVSAATPEAMEATYAEIRAPRYRRNFTLSRELDTGRIDAQLKDGVLRLRIPKQEQAQPRRISVKTA